MLEEMVQKAVKCNNLRKTMLYINLVHEQNNLTNQQNELSHLEDRVKVFGARKRHFKKTFYRFLLDCGQASDKHFINHIDDKRKAKAQELQSKIAYAQEQITKLLALIADLKTKLKRIEHKLEKFKIIPELLDDEFSGSI